MTNGPGSVLDASALRAYLQDEPGSLVVGEALALGAAISAGNLAEVLSKLVDGTGQLIDSVIRRLRELGLIGGLLMVLPLAEEDAVTIARLRPATRPQGLSLADRACIATGLRLGLPILTSDRGWETLAPEATIRVIR